MDQISGSTPTDAAPQAQEQGRPAEAAGAPEPPGFRARGRARRRARFLRNARELAYRDLGGLVFNLHRFGQRNDALVLAKLTTLGHIDAELRALEGALQERSPVTVLREAGITACLRCAAIHSSEDSFCPNCGLSRGRQVDLPADLRSVAGATVTPAAAPTNSAAPAAPPTAPTTAAVPASGPATGPTPPASVPRAQAPAPALPADAAGAPEAPPAPPPGRSPAPPGASATSSPRVPARSPTDSPAEEEPTEITRPPVAGS